MNFLVFSLIYGAAGVSILICLSACQRVSKRTVGTGPLYACKKTNDANSFSQGQMINRVR